MAVTGNEFTIGGLESGEDLSADTDRGLIVRFIGANQIGRATNATTTTMAGVLITSPKTYENCSVVTFGKTKVIAGAAITVNALITTDSSGHATTAGSGAMVIGRALEAGVTNGDRITALIHPPFILASAE